MSHHKWNIGEQGWWINQLIAKAGIKPNVSPVVVDATAGLGKDAFVLASLGCHVTMAERNPLCTHTF